MMMTRLVRHAHHGGVFARRCFPPAALRAIEAAVRDCESYHSGELRFVVESALSLAAVCRRLSPRQRAEQVFSDLRVWDTAHNDGVLIYVLLADRSVEIVADRGVAQGCVPQSEWDAACRTMQTHFRDGHYETGAVAGIRAVADVLARYPAGPPDVGNEQPDAPVILR